ncbi:MAG: hypothetical protein UR39_C0003G0063 [Candidatus Woesebacteria bacterium GW2011_GWA1_33_30]|uniref:Calcineurin-like phosphoesterase domain-containing protein n=1 Tax=Candidatus Woesebacteria bacterium GW2011_GWA2_33_28 TaxID=1618561 RepID=A0A0G0A8S3_9BACT|nr:MAG: hypothetical protein UR38_C0003G0066 [Candidatus Woesebacteria bacterium GW2011_GWA2_33_28]KKP48528.1 MAG: hypothetical protein UR39_C0003G0063 [Candidatus Woesebacteria bacterium GW2011_GWA1_33_30]KKP49667.1 MAG: hypothetical protein UR40_C0004G0066 [Microgenomates group bacterium GW2011_GWC1_33_32]KKP52284.1 MAG: hypothetical protein UR44_C0003G0066 [Candidatus Woesebacteria bacterium GW2011_GWB1_33_38]KKP58115.1 MAG: hypothetical protein UR48_C0007G0005 [Microgenomates group bacteriu
MKIVIIGDSHNNVSNLKYVMGFAKKIRAGAIIHTGDWNNFDNIKIVSDYAIPLYSCLGNADIDPNFKFKEELEIELDSLKIGICHSIKNCKLKIKNLDVVFCGHTHKQGQEKNVINPGALENGINFAIFDTKTKGVEFIQE